MGKTLEEKLEELSPEQRKEIEEEANLLIAEEMTRQQLRQALKLRESDVTIKSQKSQSSR